MFRLIGFLAVIVGFAVGLSWLADRPGDILVDWQGYRIKIELFWATVGLALTVLAALVLWSLFRHIWESPAAVGRFFQKRRQTHGLDALSSGMIAIGAGDRESAVRYAVQARKSLPNEPLTHLLRAQAAQLAGDKATSRRIFEAMLSAPDTEQLGLRGLYLEAVREGEEEAALQFAGRAVKLNPKLEWSASSLFDLQCKRGDWRGALDSLAIAKRHGLVEKASADRRRAVLLTAQAQAAEDSDPETALNLALEAHGLAPDLIPASAIAGRALASRMNTPRAARILQKTWKTSPHPDLAVAYAYARLGDSPRDRLERVTKLAATNPHTIESPIAVATAAIEAKDFATARHVLKPLLEGRLTQRVCTLMARVEADEQGNKGRVREWLARAVNAPRDPAWTADGIVSEVWAPISPVTGALDAFQWRVPVESLDASSQEILASKLEELVALGAPVAGGVAATSEAAAASPVVDVGLPGEVLDVSPVTHDSSTYARRGGGASKKTSNVGDVSAGDGTDRSSGDRMDSVIDAGDVETSVASNSAEKVSVVESDDGDEPTKSKPTSGKTKTAKRPGSADGKTSTLSQDDEKSSKGADSTVNAKAKAKSRKGKRKAGADVDEPRIFVSPRAPDDPGPGSSVERDDGRPTTDNPYRRVTS